MHLLVVHYHWRPGGVRQVVETTVASLAADPRSPVRSLRLASGEPPPEAWAHQLQAAVGPHLPLDWLTEPWFAYASQWPGGPANHQAAVTAAAARLLRTLPEPRVVLLENPAVGRHPLIGRAFAEACAATGALLLCHHHDFFLDGRWSRWPEWVACGLGSLKDALASALPAGPHVTHLAVSARDAAWLSRCVPAMFSPNPVARPSAPSPQEIDRARAWCRLALGTPAPLWLCPTRVLRRKNLAEAALLACLLAPGAVVATTAGVSSPEEARYARSLAEATARGPCPLRLGLRADAEAAGQPVPSIPSLMAASDRIVVPSLFEGFGLPVLEASVLGAPCLARAEACPDGSPPPGVRAYDDVRIPWDVCGGATERARQELAWARWRKEMPPEAAAALPDPPWWLDSGPIAFSRLTLHGQFETLRACHDPATAAALLSLNPGLISPPATTSAAPPRPPAAISLADLLCQSAPAAPSSPPAPTHGLLENRMARANLYPLLWPGGDAPTACPP